jgi:hypothetical protein
MTNPEEPWKTDSSAGKPLKRSSQFRHNFVIRMPRTRVYRGRALQRGLHVMCMYKLVMCTQSS